MFGCDSMKLSSSCRRGFCVKGTINNRVVCVNCFIGVFISVDVFRWFVSFFVDCRALSFGFMLRKHVSYIACSLLMMKLS